MVKSTLCIFLIALSSFGFGQNSDAVLGTWLTQIEDAKIEVYKKGNSYFGRVVWMAEPLDEDGKPQVDKENPNPDLKTRPILNMDILLDLTYDDGEWTDGYIYDPKSGDIFDCKIWIEDGNLMMRGYSGWLYDTKTWTKVN
jgi:uncharacterized protein (DUF2147 family)